MPAFGNSRIPAGMSGRAHSVFSAKVCLTFREFLFSGRFGLFRLTGRSMQMSFPEVAGSSVAKTRGVNFIKFEPDVQSMKLRAGLCGLIILTVLMVVLVSQPANACSFDPPLNCRDYYHNR